MIAKNVSFGIKGKEQREREIDSVFSDFLAFPECFSITGGCLLCTDFSGSLSHLQIFTIVVSCSSSKAPDFFSPKSSSRCFVPLLILHDRRSFLTWLKNNVDPMVGLVPSARGGILEIADDSYMLGWIKML